MTHSIRTLLCCAFTAAVASAADLQDGPFPIQLDGNVSMKTRDGVTLLADIYRPKIVGKFPVILLRTPYDKHLYIGEATSAATRGYACVIQDERGRFASEGEWYPFRDDGKDGYDAVEWAAQLPYSNGKVALAGISYVAAPVLLGAAEAPPHLVAIYPGVTASDYHSNWAYQGGALCLMFDRGWAGGMAVNEVTRAMGKAKPLGEFSAQAAPASLPVIDLSAIGNPGAFYQDWLSHPAYDSYWKAISIEEKYPQIKVPALHMGAWYDLFMPGATRNYTGLRDRGGSPEARKGQRLVIIPGGHAGFGRQIGDLDLGPEAAFDFWGYGLRWFDWVLKGLPNGVRDEKPVRIFVLGKNIWRDEDDWPLSRAHETEYYLHSGGHAATMKGDGSLDTTQPASERPDRFTYDPANPVPTIGGVLPGLGQEKAGPHDQSVVELRPDVLVFTSAPVSREVEVTGPIALKLYVTSSAPDTDFTGKLVDVWPTGYAEILSEGILRMRYRESMEREKLMEPGSVYAVTVELLPTSNVFLPGHRIRLEVSSSNFPHYDRNPNVSEQPERATHMETALNCVLHDTEHPSALILPIVPQ
jgi:uncharacterized protein